MAFFLDEWLLEKMVNSARDSN